MGGGGNGPGGEQPAASPGKLKEKDKPYILSTQGLTACELWVFWVTQGENWRRGCGGM